MRDTQSGLCALAASRAKRLFLALFVSLLFLAIPSPSRAEQALSLKATVGLDGYARLGAWAPVTVLLENNGREVDGDLVASLSTRSRPQETATRRTIRLPAGARQRHHLFVHVDDPVQRVFVRFRDVAAEASVRIFSEHDRVLLAVSEDRSALSFVQGTPVGPPSTSQHGAVDDQRVACVAHTDAVGLPPVSLAYSSVDVVALGTTPVRALSVEQWEALLEWVADGGTLVISGGSDVARLRDPFWKDLLPVANPVPRTPSSLSALEAQFGGTMPPGPAVVAAGQPVPGARVWISQGDVPLIVSRLQGNGTILFLAFDDSQAPVRGWAGQTALWQEILGGRTAPRIALTGQAGCLPIQRPGLFIELANTVATNPSMDLPDAQLIGLFFLAYLLCLVPINYRVLRYHNRLEYAWATTPAIALFFCGVAYLLTVSAKGSVARLYRLDVVESQAGSHTATGMAYLGLFSPVRARYTLKAPGTVGLAEAKAWANIWERPLLPVSLTLGNETQLEEIAMHMNSTCIFTCPIRQELGGAVTAKLHLEANGLGGTIENGTRCHLEGGVLFWGQVAQKVGAIASGGQTMLVPSARWIPPLPPSHLSAEKRILDTALSSIRQELDRDAFGPTPILIAWGDPAGVPIEITRRRAAETRVTLYVFRLSLPNARGGGLTIPAGMIPSYVQKRTSNVRPLPDGKIEIPPSGYIVKHFSLPDTGNRISEITFKPAGAWITTPGRLEISVFDSRAKRWVELPRDGDLYRVPRPEQAVYGPRNLLEARVSVDGGEYRMDDLGLSVRLR
ncbi:MAG: hypothetical protein GX785_05050 [Armatimonadetes bacterium]|nr:hypothetical protein [Armatimonadota bacterium]